MTNAFDPIAYINEPRWMESRLGLERIYELLDRLGRPQDDFKAVHVAGTNGKGSTCVLTASILQAAGYRTGLFTSPYIVEFSDRIKVDGRNISADDLREVTLAVKREAEAMTDHPTEFELMTAVAFLHFSRQKCAIAVVEVGLGGRLDSTNVLESPEVCAIASIALDHTALLGNTLAKIAHEKAGIIKPGVPVVSWPQAREAMEVVEQTALTCGSNLQIPDFSQLAVGSVLFSEENSVQEMSVREDEAHPLAPSPVEEKQLSGSFRTFSYKGYGDLAIRLLGSYQPYNAAVVLEIIEVLRSRDWHISDDSLREGFASARWPGRFEVVASHPTVVIDGGHNPEGARALAESLSDVFPGEKVVFIVGVLEDKEYPDMLEAVLPLGRAFIAIEPPNPRALPAAKLTQAIRWTEQDLLGCSACSAVSVADDIPDAIERAMQLAGKDGLVCAYGSLYSVAAIKDALADRG